MNGLDNVGRENDEYHYTIELGATYYRLEQFEEALEAYEKAIQIRPFDSIAYVNKANCLRKLKLFQLAINAFEYAIYLDPNNVSAYIGICNTSIKLEDFQAALLAHEIAINLDSRNANAYNSRGMIHRLQGQLKEALNAFDEAIKLSKDGDNLAGFYYNKGLTLCDFGRYDEALEGFEIAIRLEPNKHKYFNEKALLLSRYQSKNSHASKEEQDRDTFDAFLASGDIFLRLQNFEHALESYDKAIKLNSQLPQPYAGKGHAFYGLNRSIDALEAYAQAIQYHTIDVNCYLNSGSILTDLCEFGEAMNMYERAFQVAPELVAAHEGRANALFALKRYQEALQAYQHIIALDAKNIVAYVRIGDIQTVLSANEEAAVSYDKALELVEGEQNLDRLWLLANQSRAEFRPAEIQFELLRKIIIKAPRDTRITIALIGMSTLYEHLYEPQCLPAEEFQLNVRKLVQVLESLPEEIRSEALLHISGNDDIRTMQLLIALNPFAIAGLGILARKLTLRLKPEPRADDLFIRFYHVLDSYGVPFEDSDWLFCRELMEEHLYLQAKSILIDLVKRKPAPDIIWLLAESLEKLNESPQSQVKTLNHFINVAPPTDTRLGLAWKRIGELFEQQLHNGMEAIRAYKQATQYGLKFPQLEEFQSGHWMAIPALHSHPDFAFPPVVVIDLESEYRPDAPSDPLIFEVGAVCVKGSTELDTYQAFIQCDGLQEIHKHHDAKPLEEVREGLSKFIEQSQQSIEQAIIVGHNLKEFDAPHLREMGLPIRDDQIIDTLTFARLLYPDNLHHNLSLLCKRYEIQLEQAHQALPDAQACARLLHALGDELVERGERLIAGFRAFVPRESVFDLVVLQPRNQAARTGYPWELDPTPSPIRRLTLAKGTPPSPQLLQAIYAERDALVECFDTDAAYAGYLPDCRKAVVTVGTRTRLERILVATCHRSDLFVLPDPHTLLCPHRLRTCILQEADHEMQLALFCLYQASHNHDASTLYPMRLPVKAAHATSNAENSQWEKSKNDTDLLRLRQILIEACCMSDYDHSDCCSAKLAAHQAAQSSSLLLATHESFLHQDHRLEGDLLIVDDIDDLQMHFAEYLAEWVSGQQLLHWSKDIYDILATSISAYLKVHVDLLAFHERLPFYKFMPYLTQPRDDEETSLLTLLRDHNQVGEAVADKLESFCQSIFREEMNLGWVQAYWLDLHMECVKNGSGGALETWSFCGLNCDLRLAFNEMFWQPFRQHILCGTAIKLGAGGTQFLRRYFGISDNVTFVADKRAPFRVYIPTDETIRPSSFLGRRSWAESAGAFLYRLALSRMQSLVVTLSSTSVTQALADTFYAYAKWIKRQVVSPYLGWTTAKIAERLAGDTYQSIAFISPHLRRSVLYDPVAIEVTGPLRFLNQRDPLVAAQMRAFTTKDRNVSPFTSYLLPQALLELKARMTSQADTHIILDSALRDAVYRDEVFNLFEEGEILDTLPEVSEDRAVPNEFVVAFSNELDKQGLSSRFDGSDEDLYAALHAYWQTDTFRISTLDQKAVVRSVLAGRDQLVVAATGGGKSLCFQLPAILLAQDVVPKVTLVISPLIALMRDQIASMRQRGVFSVVVLDSMISSSERDHYLRGIKRGDYSIIYIAPEQVHSSALLRALLRREIGLIAIDEAHCVSQWGHNFRTAYFELKKWINDVSKGRYTDDKRPFPLLAVTATARKGYVDYGRNVIEKATVEDIIEKLGLHLTSSEVVLTSPERPELEFRAEHIVLLCPNCHAPSMRGPGEVRCEQCHQRFSISKEAIRQTKLNTLIQLLGTSGEKCLRNRWDQTPGNRQRGIIYCRTVDETMNVCRDITAAFPTLRVDVYHGNLTKLTREKRNAVYQRFMSDEEGQDGLDIVVATTAFGMGIDARRLGFVIHFDVPATLEAYYQEAGRAGRDPTFQPGSNTAQCILLYHESDLEHQRKLISRNRITQQDIDTVYEALYKLKGSGQQEILVTESVIELLSGIDNEKIASCLFYLEYHTQAKGEPLLERRENALNLKQLKFERGYEQRMSDPLLHPQSRRLAEFFCSASGFQLNEEQAAIIDESELAVSLGWELSTLEDEIRNLARRHILAFTSPMYMKWNRNRTDCCAVIDQFVKDIRTLLNSVGDQSGLQNGKQVDVSIQGLYEIRKLSAVPLPIFTHFLAELAKMNAGDLQLFDTFKKAVNPSLHESYRLRLKLPPLPSIADEIINMLQKLRNQLLQPVQRFGYDELTDEWCYVDLLTEAPDYVERQQLNRSLLWLSILGLLTFHEEGQRAVVMRVNFLQDIASSDDLEIDLTSLRLVERYGESKLAIVRDYALLSEEQRRQLLLSYFFGENPLVEPFALGSDLTDEQKALVTLTGGFHLVQGPAGSGKTTLLQEHFRFLVESLLVPADHILVTAHFQSAVDRLGSHLEYLQDGGKPIPTKTLHSLSEGIFRQQRHLLKGIDGQSYFQEGKGVRLLIGAWNTIEDNELELVSKALEKLYQDKTVREFLPANLELPRLPDFYRLDDSKERDCLKAIRLFRLLGIFPPDISYRDDIRAVLERVVKGNTWLLANLAFYYATYISYQFIQRERGVYTFDDQVLFALAILKANPAIAKQWQRKYEHIIIDEFQDFTRAGAELIGMLSHKQRNVLAVGDVRQQIKNNPAEKIALSDIFEIVSDENPVQEYHLTNNFRSVQEILDFANAIAPNKESKQLSARGYRGVKPIVIPVDQGAFQASKNGNGTGDVLVQAMVDAALHYLKLLPPEDAGSAVFLVAKSELSYPVQLALRRRGYPFAVLENKHRYQSYHIKRFLTYFRLIQDGSRTDEAERLLRHCVSPYFKNNQISMLKEIARSLGMTLLETALEQNVIEQIGATEEHLSTLQQHMAVIQKYTLGSSFQTVWQSIRDIHDEPDIESEEQALAEEHNEESKELDEVLDELGEMTVQQALEHIDSYITFIEKNRTNRKLVVANINNAKSQDFDSVFLLGADTLIDRRRWYVSVTRARQRFFCLVDASSTGKDSMVLASIPKDLFEVEAWPC
jgi:superfamily II DNA helicase RecQ/superfamily I DNA/RNA helicase/tetratricopeptide (TPR) repeat protein